MLTKRRKIVLWIGLVLSIPAAGYAAVSVGFYYWLNMVDPEGWPAARASLWAGSALVLTILFLVLFVYCVVRLIKNAIEEYRKRQRRLLEGGKAISEKENKILK